MPKKDLKRANRAPLQSINRSSLVQIVLSVQNA